MKIKEVVKQYTADTWKWLIIVVVSKHAAHGKERKGGNFCGQ